MLNPPHLTVYVILDYPMTDINFNLGPRTEAYFGCTVVFKGETIVFGGKKEPQQVSFENYYSISANLNFIFCFSSAKLSHAD